MLCKFGDFSPDKSLVIPDACPVARGVIPGPDGYRPLNEFSDLGIDALPSEGLGGVAVRGIDNIVRVFLGTNSKLYEISGKSLVNRTRASGGDYSLTLGNRWDFSQYKNQIIATALDEDVQVLTLGGTNFAKLITSANAPKAKYATVSGLNFLTLAYLNDPVEGILPTRVAWSARGNISDFYPDYNTLAGNRDLDQSKGEIVGLFAREFTCVFQERGINRMTYEGGKTIYRFDLVEANNGPLSRGSFTGFGSIVFYLSLNGFFAFDGNSSTPIGEGILNQYILNSIDYDKRDHICSAIYPSKNLVVFGIPMSGSSTITRLLFYNWVLNKWSEAEASLDLLIPSYSQSVGLDDADYSNLYLDSAPQSEWLIDDPAFTGGVQVMAAVNTSHKYTTASGNPVRGTLETGYINSIGRVFPDRVVPIVEGMNNPQLYLITRDSLRTPEQITGPFELNIFDEFEPFGEGRYMRFRLELDQFSKAVGLDVMLNKVGML